MISDIYAYAFTADILGNLPTAERRGPWKWIERNNIEDDDLKQIKRLAALAN